MVSLRRRCSRALAFGSATALLLLQGCAAPGQPVQQTLRVETPGCPQAQCSLSNERGRWELSSTPGSITVTSSHDALRVVCRSADGSEGQTGAASSLPAVGHGGAVMGGVVGTGVGLAAAAPAMVFIPPLGVIIAAFGTAVGAASGQAIESHQRDIRYPELITIPMNCGPAVELARGASRAPLGFGIRGLTPQQRLSLAPTHSGVALEVTDVTPGSAAARSGLRPGDLVLAAQARPVADAAALQVLVQALAVGETLSLRVWREGQALDFLLVQPAWAPP